MLKNNKSKVNIYKILHYISKSFTYVFFLCLIWLIQKYTIGFLISYCFGNILVVDMFYLLTSIILIHKLIEIGSPYRKYF